MENTREHILKVATRLFFEKSFKEVTMKEIVKKTGMSKGAFYHYFTSKEQLFSEIVKGFFEIGRIDYKRFSQTSLTDFYHQYLQSVERFMPIFKRWVGDTGTVAGKLNFFTLMFDAVNHAPGFEEYIKEMHRTEFATWKKIIRVARERGEIRSPMTDHQIAEIFCFTADGLRLRAIFNGHLEEMTKEIDKLFDGFYQQLKA